MALPLILTYAQHQLDQRGIILNDLYNTKRAIHSGGSFFPPLHPTPYTLHYTPLAYFATSTLKNELLVIIDQQKVRFMIIFAA